MIEYDNPVGEYLDLDPEFIERLRFEIIMMQVQRQS